MNYRKGLNVNAVMLVKISSVKMHCKRKWCECHTRLFFQFFILSYKKLSYQRTLKTSSNIVKLRLGFERMLIFLFSCKKVMKILKIRSESGIVLMTDHICNFQQVKILLNTDRVFELGFQENFICVNRDKIFNEKCYSTLHSTACKNLFSFIK